MEGYPHILLALGLGLGLAAAAGLRVFVPLLVLGLASRYGVIPLASGFEWLQSTPALLALGTATGLEVLAYYIPWFDNLLDTVATPSAAVAGVVATASVLGELPPWMQWGIAIVGGGGTAGLVAGSTSLLRLKSTAFTGGSANFILATLEWVGSLFTSIIAIALPLLMLLVIALAGYLLYRVTRHFGRPRVATAGS
jgi:hypothetical protein